MCSPALFARLRPANRARLIARKWLEDSSLCGCCAQPMRILSAISSPAQDDVIEKGLRARGERDPPWTRERRTRSPPRQLEMFGTVLDEECSQVRSESEEEFNQDPPASDEPL